ncbi:MAG: sulfurtransferase TusA family protein [Stygiobacter sp.]|jgi:TusA-related sulfurtransferase|uniref:Sulfurtransferase TusA family protein n=1 Tax=Stygiobacter electus TaxID=3032292 RepID=A0AAE3P0H4_9BACT|nr:sulfurtransferase TusA family protein [Stygiobacter electus]MDF1612132.1 sulfurtransferase TusA family protein [Stygiobacter electus]
MKTFKLDITKEHCPMTFVKTKLELEKLSKGDILEVVLKEGEPLENVPKTVTEQGNKVLEIKNIQDDIFLVIIEKG